jgi:hypothetical protein
MMVCHESFPCDRAAKGKHGGSSGSLARRCSGKLLGGSAEWDNLASLIALAAGPPTPPATAAPGPADLQPRADPLADAPPPPLGFSLLEPADSAAYTSHAAPGDLTELWASPRPRAESAAAAAAGPSVRLVPVVPDAHTARDTSQQAAQQAPCSGSRLPSHKAPSPLDGTLAARGELLLSQASAPASCHKAAGWGILGGSSAALKPLLCFASFGALCAAVFEALPLVL